MYCTGEVRWGIYEIIWGSPWVTVLCTKMAITAKTVNFFTFIQSTSFSLPPKFSLSVIGEFLQLWRISKKLLGNGKWNDLCLSCQMLRLLKPVRIGTFNTSCLHLKLATSCTLCSWASTNCVLPQKKTCQVLLQVRCMWPQNQCLLGTDHNLESVSDTSRKHIPPFTIPLQAEPHRRLSRTWQNKHWLTSIKLREVFTQSAPPYHYQTKWKLWERERMESVGKGENGLQRCITIAVQLLPV